MLDHKTNLIKCKKVKIISDMLSNHSEVKLKYSNRNLGNSQIWGNYTCSQMINGSKKSQEKLGNTFKGIKMKTTYKKVISWR